MCFTAQQAVLLPYAAQDLSCDHIPAGAFI